MDKWSVLFGIAIGIIIGLLIAGIFLIVGVSDILGHLNFQVQSASVNTTVNIPLNESRLIEAINQTR